MEWKRSDDIRTRSEIENNIKQEPAIEIHSTLYENGKKLVELESDIEDSCVVMEALKYVDSDTDDQKPDLLSAVHKIPKSKHSFEFSKLISESLCRLCAFPSDSMVHILDRNESENNIIDRIEYCFPIRVKNADTLPKKICQLCLEKLELCYQFHKTVAEAEKRFLMFNDGEVNEERLETLSALHNETQILPKKPETTDTAVIANETVPPNTKLQNAKRKTRSSSRQNQTISNSELNMEESGRICRDTGVVENEVVPQNAKIQTEKRRTRSQALAGDGLQESRRSGRLPSIPKFVSPPIISNHTEFDSLKEAARNDNGNDNIVACEKVPNRQNIDSKIISCRICKKTFKTEKDWYKHEVKHVKDKSSRREVQTNSSNESRKTSPRKSKLNPEELKQKIGAKKNFKCKKCDKAMQSKPALKRHLIVVHKQFACIYCARIFHKRGNLNAHLQIHRMELTHECDICGRLFRIEKHRTSHRRIHTGERPFECTICEKSFHRLDTLNIHSSSIHSDIKPHKCSLCPLSFRTVRTRDVHLRTHTGKKPYECDICGTDYERKLNLDRHRGTRCCRERLAVANLK